MPDKTPPVPDDVRLDESGYPLLARLQIHSGDWITPNNSVGWGARNACPKCGHTVQAEAEAEAETRARAADAEAAKAVWVIVSALSRAAQEVWDKTAIKPREVDAWLVVAKAAHDAWKAAHWQGRKSS